MYLNVLLRRLFTHKTKKMNLNNHTHDLHQIKYDRDDFFTTIFKSDYVEFVKNLSWLNDDKSNMSLNYIIKTLSSAFTWKIIDSNELKI